jgi:hypothetical protein
MGTRFRGDKIVVKMGFRDLSGFDRICGGSKVAVTVG